MHVVSEVIHAARVFVYQEILSFLFVQLSHVNGLKEFLCARFFIIIQHIDNVLVLLYELRELAGVSAPLVDLCQSGTSWGQLRVIHAHDLAWPELARVD
jgi:hypothetical protein